MIELETIEELESKIIKALELISDLRMENSRLESENETLRAEHDEMKLAMEEKQGELGKVKNQLSETANELSDLKAREEQLDKKINSMLQRLETLANYKNLAASSAKKQEAVTIPSESKPEKKVEEVKAEPKVEEKKESKKQEVKKVKTELLLIL